LKKSWKQWVSTTLVEKRDMNSIRFEINGITITKKIPSSWNELSLDQLLFVIARVMFVNKSLRLRRELLYYFLKMKNKHLQEMNLTQEKALFAAIDWLFKSPTLTRNLIPSLKLDDINFNGPDDEMKNISVSQFAFADKFLSEFLKSKDEQQLNMLIGTLYTLDGKPFIKEEIENIADKITQVPLDKRLAILAFFIGCRNKISESNSDIFKKSNKVRRSKTGWLGFFYELAGPKIGAYTDVADMNFFEMLGIMRKINEDAREMEKRNKRRR
jgi:hypothetical protein